MMVPARTEAANAAMVAKEKRIFTVKTKIQNERGDERQREKKEGRVYKYPSSLDHTPGSPLIAPLGHMSMEH